MRHVLEIIKIAEIAQAGIIRLLERDPNNDDLEQAGMIDGLEIVRDYLDHNELGCAVEHGIYMINESGIVLPGEYSVIIERIADEFNIRINTHGKHH